MFLIGGAPTAESDILQEPSLEGRAAPFLASLPGWSLWLDGLRRLTGLAGSAIEHAANSVVGQPARNPLAPRHMSMRLEEGRMITRPRLRKNFCHR